MRSRTDIDPPALPPALRWPIGVVAAASAVVVVVLGVVYAGESVAGPTDVWTSGIVRRLWGEPGLGWMLVAVLGDPIPAAFLSLLMAGACLAGGRRRLAAVAVTGVLATGVATSVLKPIVGRTIHDGHLAFPSGHTGALTALAVIAALMVIDRTRPRAVLGTLLVVCVPGASGALMGFAMIANDTHYPTDTLGGLCVALSVVPALAFVADRFPWQRTGPR